jgi:leader peptidase (prepilin peptidase)/N-methyltransferase
MQVFYGVLFFILGSILASFITVISERIYTGQSWLQGRSRCNSCRRQLSIIDLVPVFSWIFFLGRCRTCKAKVPGTYVVSELLLGFVFALSYNKFGFSFQLAVFLAATAILFFIVLYDLRHTIVPWGSCILSILVSILFLVTQVHSVSEVEVISGIAIAIGLGFMLLYLLSRGRAMGLGDAPVAFSLSLLVGAAAVPGLLFSFWIGAVVGIIILVFRRGGPKIGIEVPFVPFLAIGYLLAFFTQWNPLL